MIVARSALSTSTVYNQGPVPQYILHLTLRIRNLTALIAETIFAFAVEIPAPATVPIGFLLGDTNSSRTVNAGDVAQTKAQSGNATTAANFRTDTNVSSSINAGDVAQVKSQSGTSLP